MEKNKMDSIALRQAVVEAHDKQDWKQVIKLCTDIIKQNPKNTEAFYNRGTAYTKLGQFDQAIQDFEQAIALNPKHAKAFYNRGLSYRQLKKEDKAIADFKKAESIDPTIISQEQIKNLEKGFQQTQASTKKVQEFQRILKKLKEEHQKEERNWLICSISAVIITLILIVFAGYVVYIFSSIVTFAIIRQYTNAKSMRIEASNRVAMAKMFERVKNENTDYQKEFLPKLADAIVYSTVKEKNNTDGLVEKIIDGLEKFKKT